MRSNFLPIPYGYGATFTLTIVRLRGNSYYHLSTAPKRLASKRSIPRIVININKDIQQTERQQRNATPKHVE
jgi:hypothetical protein